MLQSKDAFWIFDWNGDPKLLTPCDKSGSCQDNYSLVCPGKIAGECWFQGPSQIDEVEGLDLRPLPVFKGQIKYRGEWVTYEEWKKKWGDE